MINNIVKLMFLVVISSTALAATFKITGHENAIIEGSLHDIFLIQVGDKTYFEKISLDDRFDLEHEFEVAKNLERFPALTGFVATAIDRRLIPGGYGCIHWSMWTKAYPAGSLAHIINSFVRKETGNETYKYSEYENYFGHTRPKMTDEQALFYLANAAMLIDKIHQAGFSWGNIKPDSLLVDQDGYLIASNFVSSKPLKKHGKSNDWRILGNRVARLGLRMDGPDVEMLVQGQVSSFEEFKALKLFSGFDWDGLAQRRIEAPFLNFVSAQTEKHLENLIFITPEPGSSHGGSFNYGANGTVYLITVGSKKYAEKLSEHSHKSLENEFSIAKHLETKDFMQGLFVRAFKRGYKFRRREILHYSRDLHETMLMECLNGSLADVINRFTGPLVDHMRGENYIGFGGPNQSYRFSEYEIFNMEAYLRMPILPIEAIKFYMANAAFILDRLHRAGIAWNDNKPDNFLINDKGYLVAADFGISQRFEDVQEDERDSLSASQWRSFGKRAGRYAFRLCEERRNQENSQAVDAVLALESGKITNFEQFKQLPFFTDFDWQALENGRLPAPRF